MRRAGSQESFSGDEKNPVTWKGSSSPTQPACPLLLSAQPAAAEMPKGPSAGAGMLMGTRGFFRLQRGWAAPVKQNLGFAGGEVELCCSMREPILLSLLL